jgi:hypothetical protein
MKLIKKCTTPRGACPAPRVQLLEMHPAESTFWRFN